MRSIDSGHERSLDDSPTVSVRTSADPWDIDRSLARAEKEVYTRLLIEGIMIPLGHLARTLVMYTELKIEQVLQAIYRFLQDTDVFTTEDVL